jgi:hypothetical protein
MGKLTPGMLGTARGKVGDVTIANVKGVAIIKKNRRPNTSSSEEQEMHRKKFGFVQQFLSLFSDLLQKTYPRKDLATGLNMASSDVFEDAVVGEYPDFSIDYSLLKIAKGKLEEAKLPAAVQNGTSLDFTWTPNADEGNAKATDKVVMLAICPELKKAKFTIGAADRDAGKATLEVTSYAGKTVHTYIAFLDAKKRVASDSTYTGAVDLA